MKSASESKKDSIESNDISGKQLQTLLGFFETKVVEATKLGKFNIDTVKFMESQLPPDVLTKLENHLKALGYNFSHSFYIAEKKYTVNLSWN